MPKSKQEIRVKVAEYGEQQLEALGLPARMDFELTDGSVVTLLNPWLWSDEVLNAYNAASTSNDGDARYIRLARAVLGDKEHQRFLKGGGRSSQIAMAIELMQSQKVDGSDPKDG